MVANSKKLKGLFKRPSLAKPKAVKAASLTHISEIKLDQETDLRRNYSLYLDDQLVAKAFFSVHLGKTKADLMQGIVRTPCLSELWISDRFKCAESESLVLSKLLMHVNSLVFCVVPKNKTPSYCKAGFRSIPTKRLPDFLIGHPELPKTAADKKSTLLFDPNYVVKTKGPKQVKEKAEPNYSYKPEFKVFPIEKIIDLAYEHYQNIGFPYPKMTIHQGMQEINRLSQTPENILMNTDVGYQLADSYHPHRFEASAIDAKSPLTVFTDERLYRKALRVSLTKGEPVGSNYLTTLNIGIGSQPCYNFRPGLALRYYREFCDESSVILDTSTGYGGRLVGFMASGCARYIGIDPHTRVYEANLRMARDFGFEDRVTLINLPAEDVDVESLRGGCDFMLTSPPYFNKERYTTEPTQSDIRYPEPHMWREGFLRKMLNLTYIALKPKSHCVISVGDILVRGKKHPLVDWTVFEASRLGFSLIRKDGFKTARKFADEKNGTFLEAPLLIFRRS